VGTLRLLQLAVDGILSFSVVPLRLIVVLGLFCAVGALLFGLGALIARYLFGIYVFEWTFGLTTISFFGGLQLLALGIIGEYIGRVYEEVKRRPQYVLRREISQRTLVEGREP